MPGFGEVVPGVWSSIGGVSGWGIVTEWHPPPTTPEPAGDLLNLLGSCNHEYTLCCSMLVAL
jgi:hypothetical protein